MNCIAVIPARGGSKRIQNKNIYQILGKPAISYAISTALKSELFSDVFVSTDSPEIASISKSHGATVGNLRDSTLSDDHSTTLDVISGFINSELNSRNYPDFICCIYPVTPLLTSNRLQEGYFLVAQNPLNFVFSAVPANSPPERIFRLSEKLEPIFGTANQIDVRTQDLPQQFNDAGQFYWGATSLWLSQDSIIGRYSKAVKLGKHEVIDVDEIEDMKLVEILLRARNDGSS